MSPCPQEDSRARAGALEFRSCGHVSHKDPRTRLSLNQASQEHQQDSGGDDHRYCQLEALAYLNCNLHFHGIPPMSAVAVALLDRR